MMKSRSDEEEYWNASKFKAFTFDDEDDDLRESKSAFESLAQLPDEDERDHVEEVSWSGEPVGSISRSVRETAASGRRTEGEAAFPARVDADLAKVNSGYSLSSLFKGRRGASVATLADVSGDRSGRTVAPEIRRPKSEKEDLVGDWSPQDAVNRMRQGKPVPLERFRCLQDKLRLLDRSVDAQDGNVITAVLIFLKKSLSKEVLFGELASRPTALRHLFAYLSESGDDALLADLYRALGRVEDAALLHYKEHLSITDEKKKRDFLKSCLSLQFSPEDQVQLQDQVSLLERQMLIEATDRQAELGGKAEIFQKFPRRASILHMPLVTTLYYCCFYHYGQPEVRSARPRSSRVRGKVPTCRSCAGPQGSFSSPQNLRNSFKISEKQFFVTALSARAKQKSWRDVDALFAGRSWLGFTRKKSPLAFQVVVDILHRNSAPVHVLQEYVGLVDDADARMALAHKHKCHDLVINVSALHVGRAATSRDLSLLSSDVSRLQRPTAVARIPREGGGGVGGREEDRRAARRLANPLEELIGNSQRGSSPGDRAFCTFRGLGCNKKDLKQKQCEFVQMELSCWSL
ncbi:spermatogenesis-defective protein 39 homolog isoform X2 [Phyllopteryx taeniolatus]|uniref:spermatogenesis-defective protein 39 homolog isoform X2 n=1 Tax=Phyllopteryx taeniolatus TaxID=161469 RepID=UPI002AD41823|nr:spermatogenesis-defective protein 39 homolog isoform X2 [Phyllopteryx taeniolatus]